MHYLDLSSLNILTSSFHNEHWFYYRERIIITAFMERLQLVFMLSKCFFFWYVLGGAFV